MDPSNPLDVGDAIGDRLAHATVAHRDAQEVAREHAGRWKQLVVEAVDSGMKIREVAELARVSSARVHAILAAGD